MKSQNQIIELNEIVPDELAGERLDQALAKIFPEFSRSRLQEWIRNEQIKVDDKAKRPKDRLMGGEKIAIHVTLENKTEWVGQKINLEVVFEDEDIIVINKPIGLVVHPAAGNPDSTLVNALLYKNPDSAKLPRAGIVHRLDKETSGLLIAAKTLPAYTSLIQQLQERSIEREYIGIVKGKIISGGTVDAPIDRHPVHRKQMSVQEDGKTAITHYRVLERFRDHTLLKINLETGRTHQIRVHMAHISHPLLGDATYGGRLQLPKGASDTLIAALRNFKHQALHATRLALIHPTKQIRQEWSVPPPQDFQNMIEVLRQETKI